ncbi:unnamed protein product, partial [Rotaria sp. Silwood1]
IQSTDGTNIKGPLKCLRKNSLAITIVSRQQSKEWKQSHSVTSSTIQATIESSSLNKVESLNRHNNETLSDLPNNQTQQ